MQIITLSKSEQTSTWVRPCPPKIRAYWQCKLRKLIKLINPLVTGKKSAGTRRIQTHLVPKTVQRQILNSLMSLVSQLQWKMDAHKESIKNLTIMFFLLWQLQTTTWKPKSLTMAQLIFSSTWLQLILEISLLCSTRTWEFRSTNTSTKNGHLHAASVFF